MVRIRHERNEDHAAVRQVHATAFPTNAEANLVEQLRDSGKAEISLVAEAEDGIVGHIVFSRVTFDPSRDVIAYGLGPMVVLLIGTIRPTCNAVSIGLP